MATIYIVNHTTGGYYVTASSSYHHTEEKAREDFTESVGGVGDDPAHVELVRLDTETLETITLDWWEGTAADLDEDEDEGVDDEDWICEGKPDGE